MQQAREGEAWLIARGRYEHLMVARTRISDGYRARAPAIVALAQSWRPSEIMPGARTWVEAQAGGLEALAGLEGIWDPATPAREGARHGLDASVLLAVAARHWSKPRLRTRARHGGSGGRSAAPAGPGRAEPTARAAVVVVEREGRS